MSRFSVSGRSLTDEPVAGFSRSPSEQSEALTQSAALLEVTDLTTNFRVGSRTLTAVDGVSLSVSRGEAVGIVGESGSGKSALARSIMGLLTRTTAELSGSVKLEGTELVGLSRRELRRIWGSTISMVFQNPLTSLNPVTKVGVQLTEAIQAHSRVSRTEARSKAVALLRDVHLPDARQKLSQYPHELSGGMRQRVAIAMAIAASPKVLIADEPTTALDVTIQAGILDLLDELREQHGMSLVLITHDMGVVAGRTDRVAVMYGGRIVECGPTRSVFLSTRMPYTSALLRSIPRMDTRSGSPLVPISGRPPDPFDWPTGCRFANRCGYRSEVCDSQPQLIDADVPGHSFACWHPLSGPEVVR